MPDRRVSGAAFPLRAAVSGPGLPFLSLFLVSGAEDSPLYF